MYKSLFKLTLQVYNITDTYGGGQRTTGAIQMANLARIFGWRSQIGQANCSALILFFIIQTRLVTLATNPVIIHE
jgi:ABC-type sugar transport system permease subunit